MLHGDEYYTSVISHGGGRVQERTQISMTSRHLARLLISPYRPVVTGVPILTMHCSVNNLAFY
jgi:hypothetical protein